MILQVVLVALLLAMGLAVIRAVQGPSVFERILAANVFGTKTLLLICVVGFYFGAPEDYVDIAIMYAIIAFIGTVAVLRCVEYGGFRDNEEDE